MTETQLENRMDQSGIDTSKISVFNNTWAEKEVPSEGQGEYRKQGTDGASFGTSRIDHTKSQIEDIHGNNYSNFDESCWIILTSHKASGCQQDSSKGSKEKDNAKGASSTTINSNGKVLPVSDSNNSVNKGTAAS